MHATGYQLSTNDFAREKVVELCEMEKGFYDQLLTQMGTDLTKGLFTSHAIVESVISGAVSSFSDKVSISLRWINDHLADLKPMANDWLNQIKTKFFASDNDIPIVNAPELLAFVGAGVSSIGSFPNFKAIIPTFDNVLILSDSIYKDCLFYDLCYQYHVDNDGRKKLFRIIVSPGENLDELTYYNNLSENDIKNMLLDGSAILKFTSRSSSYLSFRIIDKKNNKLASGLGNAPRSLVDDEEGVFCIASGIKVLLPDKTELIDIVSKPQTQTLDNVKNYTDNLNDHKLDGVGYVSPNSLQLDKTNHDTYVVSNPGELDFPYTLPNDLTVDPTKPYEGTDGKTVDKPWNPTLPWALPADLPVSIPLPNDAVLPNDLPYDDVIDAAKHDPADPTLDPDYTTPKVNDDDYSDTYRDWHKIFPFCIPWDYAKIVNFFRADKKAPSFEFDLGNVVTSGKKSKTLKVDLSEYEEQGKWLRNLEMILFAVGLLLITRYIIKG